MSILLEETSVFQPAPAGCFVQLTGQLRRLRRVSPSVFAEQGGQWSATSISGVVTFLFGWNTGSRLM